MLFSVLKVLICGGDVSKYDCKYLTQSIHDPTEYARDTYVQLMIQEYGEHSMIMIRNDYAMDYISNGVNSGVRQNTIQSVLVLGFPGGICRAKTEGGCSPYPRSL